jgi:hypothetical protein
VRRKPERLSMAESSEIDELITNISSITQQHTLLRVQFTPPPTQEKKPTPLPPLPTQPAGWIRNVISKLIKTREDDDNRIVSTAILKQICMTLLVGAYRRRPHRAQFCPICIDCIGTPSFQRPLITMIMKPVV